MDDARHGAGSFVLAALWALHPALLPPSGISYWQVPAVSAKALRELRRRLGPAPLKAQFEVVAGPLAQPRTPGGLLRRDAHGGL